MSRIEEYEAVRNMSDEEFSLLKFLHTAGHSGTVENVLKGVNILVAALLGYVSYEAFKDANTTLAVTSGIGTAFLLLRKRIEAFIISVFTTSKVMKRPDRVELGKKMVDMIAKLKKNKLQRYQDRIDEIDRKLEKSE